MTKIKSLINKLTNHQKIIYSIIFIVLIFAIVLGIPTLARLTSGSGINEMDVWDGQVASSYQSGSGTQDDPYIISNGAQLAYFSNQAGINNYANTYFELNANIVLNAGFFDYNNADGIMYRLNETIYYINPFTTDYYITSARDDNRVDKVNIFPSIPNFQGHFDGKGYTIFGAYITDSSAYDLGLFTNLQGTIKNLQVANGMVYGGIRTGGLASDTNSAMINNVLFDGNVVGTNTEQNKTMTMSLSNLVLSPGESPDIQTIDILNKTTFLGGEIISSSLQGTCLSNNDPTDKISITVNNIPIAILNQEETFDLNLGDMIQNLTVIATITDPSFISELNNLVYTITYNYASTGGLIGHSVNTSIVNSINNAAIDGKLTSGGLIGTATGFLDINRSYNNGTILGTFATSGLVGLIEKSTGVNINQSYNAGNIEPVVTSSSGLIGYMFNNAGNINLTKTFNSANTYTLGDIRFTNVDATDSYHVYDLAIGSGTLTSGNFIKKDNVDLQTKDVLISMGFYEFIDEENLVENPQNCWVHKDNEYPLLYSDSKNKPIANIYVGTSVFNRFDDEPMIKPVHNLTYLIEAANIFQPVKEKHYYIVSGETPLTKTELENIDNWLFFEGVNSISVEGKYIIYAKIIDYNNVVTYLNTDILWLDLDKPNVTVNINENTWTELTKEVNHVAINADDVLSIEAYDQSTGVDSINYYFSEDPLDTKELNAVNNGLWQNYDDEIELIEGRYIVYIKVADIAGNVTYINTDLIDTVVMGSYNMINLSPGRRMNAQPLNTFITDKSSITVDFLYYEETPQDLEFVNHNLVSSILLPMGTKITMFDKIKKKVYNFTVLTTNDEYGYETSCQDSSCENYATYPFTLFKEVGTGSNLVPFVESSYFIDGTITEQFTFIIDFAMTSITTNYENVGIHLEMVNNTEKIRITDPAFIKYFSLYSEVEGISTKATLNLISDYEENDITLNSDSTTVINLISKINYRTYNNFEYIDTTFEDQKMGLQISLEDSNGTLMNNEYLKHLNFQIEDSLVGLGNDNIIRALIKNENVTIKIITQEHTNSLTEGTYYLKIRNFMSFDGYYSDTFGSDVITIPVVITNNSSMNTPQTFGFNVEMITDTTIVNNQGSVTMTFDIIKTDNLINPTIRVSLYQKTELTAYNQNYNLIDLQDYVLNNLNRYANNIYYVDNSTFSLNLITNNLEKTGYRLVFELYDANQRIEVIKKHFIVK